MLSETSEYINSIVSRLSNVLNSCKTSVVDKESLRDDVDYIINQICDMHSKLTEYSNENDPDVFPKTIPYTNLLHLQARNKMALKESQLGLEDKLKKAIN